MRTIETTATITPDGQLILQIPADISPGKHRIVLVIEEQLEEESEEGTEQPSVETEDPIFGLGTHPIDCGLVDAAENHDRYLYTGL
jgi:hypothetical protein